MLSVSKRVCEVRPTVVGPPVVVRGLVVVRELVVVRGLVVVGVDTIVRFALGVDRGMEDESAVKDTP